METKNEEGEKKITKEERENSKKKIGSSLSQRSKTPSLVRSHNLLKTDLSSPLMLGEYHTIVCLPE